MLNFSIEFSDTIHVEIVEWIVENISGCDSIKFCSIGDYNF